MEKKKYLQPNCLLQNNSNTAFINYGKLLMQLAVFLFWQNGTAQRIGNYVANGSFEEFYICTVNDKSLLQVKNWMGIDSLCGGAGWLSKCNGQMPVNGSGYQVPKTGNAYIIGTMYCAMNNCGREYLKNRLKANLQAGRTYCVKFYVNITNVSPRGMDGFGAYFGDHTIDTITKCTIPLTYITPQVQNPHGNVISDTLNWVPITGTFTANGTEKFVLLGNFLADNAVTTASINTPYYPATWTDVLMDDVSCIEVDLPAYAGRDTSIYLGDSTYIGREPDFAIDPGCVWYKLPNTTTAIDTISGLWVKPHAPGTYTYVVRQELDCSPLKWDTVVVTVLNDAVGLREYTKNNRHVALYPIPANDQVILKSTGEREDLIIRIYDLMGRQVLSKQVKTENFTGSLDIDLINGAYMITITNGKDQVLTTKLLIAK